MNLLNKDNLEYLFVILMILEVNYLIFSYHHFMLEGNHLLLNFVQIPLKVLE